MPLKELEKPKNYIAGDDKLLNEKCCCTKFLLGTLQVILINLLHTLTLCLKLLA